MGIDMHMLVEVRHRDEDPWRPLRDEPMARKVPRNNVMFAMLADVGNRSGRWDRTWQEPQKVTTDTGEEVDMPGWWYEPDDGGHDHLEPIDVPRGIPDDASIAWMANVAIWQGVRGADIICSWITPEEILAGDWDQAVYRQGVMWEEEYLLYKDKGVLPETFAGQAGGEGLRIVNEVEYAAGERGETSTAVSLRWRAGTAREMCADFLELVDDMAAITRLKPTSRLRFMLLFEC